MDNRTTSSLLLAFASRHGATEEIARRISTRLRQQLPPADWRIDVIEANKVEDLVGYDAVVLGSAIYLGRWLRPAMLLLKRAAAEPPLGLWLFSSGPVDDEAENASRAPVATGIPVRDSVVFGGRIDRSALSALERAVTRLIGVTDGDYRDWDAIDAWASSIADVLLARAGTAPKDGPSGKPGRDFLP